MAALTPPGATPGLLMDTDVLIDVERGLPNALTWIGGLLQQPSVCGFAAMELIHGSRNERERRALLRFLLPFPSVWPTEADMNRALHVYSRYRLSHNLGMIDALVAATAVGAGLDLVTFNVRHFRAVLGLTTVQPYAR